MTETRADSVAVAAAEGVSKSFGATTALDDVAISIAPGEAHALVGRNGAGKSTLVSLLTGLARPDGGRILFDGEPAPPLSHRAAWQARAACVYQKSTIIPTLSVAENLFLNRQADGLRRISWKALPAPAGTRPALEIKDLSLPGAYEDFSVTVGEGEIVGLAGAGGSGVVTLGETVAGLHRPSAGTVTVAGRTVRTGSVPDALHAGLGFV